MYGSEDVTERTLANLLLELIVFLEDIAPGNPSVTALDAEVKLLLLLWLGEALPGCTV